MEYNIVYNFEICKAKLFVFISETDLFKLLLFNIWHINYQYIEDIKKVYTIYKCILIFLIIYCTNKIEKWLFSKNQDPVSISKIASREMNEMNRGEPSLKPAK